MLFNVIVGETKPLDMFMISGSSWSNCVAYCEGLGKTIFTINLLKDELIYNPSFPNNCFGVTLVDTDTLSNTQYILFDSFSNVINWVNAQTDKSLKSIQSLNRELIVI